MKIGSVNSFDFKVDVTLIGSPVEALEACAQARGVSNRHVVRDAIEKQLKERGYL